MKGTAESEEQELKVAVVERLEALELLAPVADEPEANLLWRKMDLISTLESCLGEKVRPEDLDKSRWESSRHRIGRQFRIQTFELASQPDAFFGPAGRFWLQHNGQRVGTIQLEALPGEPWLQVMALYVAPEHRGQGLASRVLQEAIDAAKEAGLLGLRLGTLWIWQKTLRFYLDRRFWVWDWRHDLRLVRHRQWPEWQFSLDGGVAAFDVVDPSDSSRTRLFRARQIREHLDLEELCPDRSPEVQVPAASTFAVLLALNGFPLIRSEQEWTRRRSSSEAGHPESLARHICRSEASARRDGWRVETPDIPGLR